MAISWEGCFSNKERKKHENNNGKQYPVWFKVIVDINGYSVRNSRCILIPDMKAFDLQWHPGNVYNFCWFSSGREPSSVRRKILIRSVNEGLWYWTYLNKKNNLFIDISFALLSGEAVNCYTYNYEDFLFCSWNSSTADSGTTDVTVKW